MQQARKRREAHLLFQLQLHTQITCVNPQCATHTRLFAAATSPSKDQIAVGLALPVDKQRVAMNSYMARQEMHFEDTRFAC